MIRSLSLLALAMVLFAPVPALAQQSEQVFVGKVSQVVVLPKRHGRCQVPCTSGHVCISTSCGCAEASVHPTRALLGSLPTQPVVISQHLDEWCRLPTRPDAVVLVQRLPTGELHSSSLWEDPERFDPEGFSRIGGISVKSLPATDGLVELQALEHGLGR